MSSMWLGTRAHSGMPTAMRASSALDLPFASFSADSKRIQQLLQAAGAAATQLHAL